MADEGEIEPCHLPTEITAGPDAVTMLAVSRKSLSETLRSDKPAN